MALQPPQTKKQRRRESSGCDEPGVVGAAGTRDRGERQRLWEDIAYQSMPPALQHNLRERCSKGISYGSDCSGIDGPLHALRSIVEASSAPDQRESAAKCLIDYHYATEINDKHGDGPKLVLTMNGKPRVLWSDMTACTTAYDKVNKQKYLKGYDCYTAMEAGRLPPHVYSMGFECQDRSSCNLSNPKPLLERAEGTAAAAGGSTTTLHASMRAIQVEQPTIVILEHVYKVDTAEKLGRIMASYFKEAYEYRIWVTCSRAFGLPMTRRRLFLVAVNTRKAKLTLPMAEWSAVLQKMAKAQFQEPLQLMQCMVDDAHPAPWRASEPPPPYSRSRNAASCSPHPMDSNRRARR